MSSEPDGLEARLDREREPGEAYVDPMAAALGGLDRQDDRGRRPLGDQGVRIGEQLGRHRRDRYVGEHARPSLDRERCEHDVEVGLSGGGHSPSLPVAMGGHVVGVVRASAMLSG